MELMYIVVGTLLILTSTTLYQIRKNRYHAPSKKSVAVLVLGDVGRSPRIMYHAQSFIDNGYSVSLIGYAGTPILPTLSQSPNLTLLHIPEPPKWFAALPRFLFLVVAPVKLVWGAAALLYTLLFSLPYNPAYLLVQTPPALPTLPIVHIASWLLGTKLIIDWHNTAYSILAMRLGKSSPFVRLAESLEGSFGKSAYLHLFVTNVMRQRLTEKWSLSGRKATFHDRPQETSHRLAPASAHELFKKLDNVLAPLCQDNFLPRPSSSQTIFTTVSKASTSKAGLAGIARRKDRPALLVSSTSWTADEDFSILLDAARQYEAQARQNAKLPKIVIVITGKGGMKAAFKESVKKLEKEWTKVRILTAWLEAGDYPKLLGASDLGVSLHSSSSGLDLPMKVVDMFGAGLPVLALDFACIGELVKDGQNGRIFRNAAELARQMQDLLMDFSADEGSKLDELRRGVEVSQTLKWQQAWNDIILPPL